MGLQVGASSVWKSGVSGVPKVGASSVWKNWVKAWVGVGGVWKEFYAPVTVELGSDQNILSAQSAPTDAWTGWKITSSGNLQFSAGTTSLSYSTYGSTWLLSGVGSDYEVRATNSGDGVTAGTVGSWLSLGSDRSWESRVTTNVGGTSNVPVLLIEVRDTATSTVQDSVTITLDSSV